MIIPIKTVEEIKAMREGGKILAHTLEEVMKKAVAGISTWELDQFAEKTIRKFNGIPAFKGYNGFPATLCTCVDEVIVHGIPSKKTILKEGDLFTVDCGVIYKGMYTDAARSIGIGKISEEKTLLLKTANEALSKVQNNLRAGMKVNEIGEMVEEIVNRNGFFVISDLTGHGVGKKLHEDPIVFNFFNKSANQVLKPGMTIAVEPIFSVGTHEMETLEDDWTIVTKDGSCAVQVENTMLITENGVNILTI